jgi:hypothetical protein
MPLKNSLALVKSLTKQLIEDLEGTQLFELFEGIDIDESIRIQSHES